MHHHSIKALELYKLYWVSAGVPRFIVSDRLYLFSLILRLNSGH